MENTKDTIERLESEWMTAWLRNDIARCGEILADDFILSSARGNLVTKQEWLDAAGSYIKGEEFTWHEIKIREYGNTVIVNAKTSQKASVGGEDWSGNFLLTDVWVLNNGKWQVVTRHGTGPIAD